MKRQIILIAALVSLALVFPGCDRADKREIDTAELERKFENAEESVKNGIDKAVNAIKTADYEEARRSLRDLADKAKLTPEQKDAIRDTLEDVEESLKETARKAVDGADRAIDRLQESLPPKKTDSAQ